MVEPVTLLPPNTPGLDEPVAESIRRIHSQKIVELQQLPITDATVIPDITLPNGVPIHVAHKLGREPNMVWVSPARGIGGAVGTPTVGYVVEVRGALPSGAPIDRTKVLVFIAGGFGATVLVDVAVF